MLSNELKKFMKEKKYIFIYLFITLFLGHIVSLILFNNLTTFYHDNLDSFVVYNHVIGKIYSGSYNNSDIFLNGELKYYYLRHFFKPISLIYSILNTELAYYLSVGFIKIIAYFSFLIITKKLTKNFFLSALFSALYASSLSYYTLGLGQAILPYLVYLISFKEKINLKHYLIIILAGLNTDFAADFLIFFIIFSISLIIKYESVKRNLKKNITIIIIFYFSSIITSLNLFYILFFGEVNHRSEMILTKNSLFFNVIDQIRNFFYLPNNLDLNWEIVKNFPLTLIVFFSIFLLVLVKDDKSNKFFFLILLINFINIITNTYKPLFLGTRLSWIMYYVPSLFIFLLFNLSLNSFKLLKKIIVSISFLILITMQINSSIVPFIKEKILKYPNYRNIYTFNGYYMYSDLKKIKKIVNKDRVMTIGFDPLISVMNDIYVIDGYHALYPLSYKKKFRKIISLELDKNKEIKNYYDNWGSRLYAFYNDKNNIELNFLEAKKIGLKFIISKYEIYNENLKLIPFNSREIIFLYKIN